MGLAAKYPDDLDFRISGTWLAFGVDEGQQGADLNGDGDTQDDRVVLVHDLETRETRNLGLAADFFGLFGDGNWLEILVLERDQGADLNGDGDTEDRVVHLHDLETGETENLGFAGGVPGIGESRLVLTVNESEHLQGKDLNSDGDTGDVVLHLHELETGKTSNLGLAGEAIFFENWLVVGDSDVHIHNLATGDTRNLGLPGSDIGICSRVAGDWFAFRVPEFVEGADLNGDGDTRDEVVHVHNLLTGETRSLALPGCVWEFSGNPLIFGVYESDQGEDLNGDSDTDDHVLHAHDLETGETTKLARSSFWYIGDFPTYTVSESLQGEDLNGDGDTEDDVLHVNDPATGEVRNLQVVADRRGHVGNWLELSVLELPQGADLNGDGDLSKDRNGDGRWCMIRFRWKSGRIRALRSIREELSACLL